MKTLKTTNKSQSKTKIKLSHIFSSVFCKDFFFAMDDWVKLNVGGKIFWTTKTTLQSEPDSMFAKMFSREFAPGTKDEKGAYLLDQNPKYFEPILDYLRTRKLINDPNVSMDGVLAVARFFGIQSLMDQIEELKQGEEKFEKEKKAKAEMTI